MMYKFMKKNPGMVFPARGKLSKILFVVRLKFFFDFV